MSTAASQTVGTSTPATAQRGRTCARRLTQRSLAPESGSFPCPARSSTYCWLTENLSRWSDREPLNFGPQRAGSLQTRLGGPSIPEPTGTAGSVYLQPLASATGASTMHVTPQPQIFYCSACTSARS